MIAWLRKSSSPAKVLLSKEWREKLAFLSPHVGRPGKAFLDHTTIISNVHPWASTSMKCSNRKHCHVRGHRYAVPPGQSSRSPPLPIKILHYCPHVQHACGTLYGSTMCSEHFALVTVHSSRCVLFEARV